MNAYSNGGYFEWLCSIIKADRSGPFRQYSNLIERLFQTPYIPTGELDDNREVNGKLLRYYYESNRYDYISREQAPHHVDGNFYDMTKDEPCTILEMLIAFANEIDSKYLYSPSSRTFIWFWMMIESMQLADYTDYNMDPRDVNSPVDEILRVFNNNSYMVDEDGYWQPTVKLFQIRDRRKWEDIRSLWEQMQVWYNERDEWLTRIDPQDFIKYYLYRYLYG